MSMAETRADSRSSALYVNWGAVVAGAVVAAALAFVLHSFAAAIGLSVSSSAPTWRDVSFALILLTGLYLVLVALASYGLGAYLAARLTARLPAATHEDSELRDGVHGLLVWAIATLFTALFTFASAQALTRVSAPSAGSSGPAVSVGSENVIAYDLDRLFRSEHPQQGDLNYARSEAGRILLTASSHRGMLPEDRNYLVRLGGGPHGLAEPDATRRVDDVIARAKDNIARARRSAPILAFMAGAAALLGAVAAWFAACAGGSHRGEPNRCPPGSTGASAPSAGLADLMPPDGTNAFAHSAPPFWVTHASARS